MTTPKEVLKMIKDNDVKYVDFRFTDPRGKWQHVTFDVSMIEEDTFSEGQMFDGSSIAGWKAINESDMNLMPDPASACIDPFFAETTLSLICDVLEPTTGEPYNRDPRGIARKAEAMVKSVGIGDTVFFGPEAEFFIFDDVKYSAQPYNTGFKLDSVEFPTNSDTEYEGGNLGHHIGFKKGYFPVPPQDTAQDMRSEMLGAMARMGCVVEKHHHEVASAQHELGLGPKKDGVADAGGFHHALGLLGDAARIAVIGLAGGGLEHVADQRQRGLGEERIDAGGGRIRHQVHVGFVNRLPAGDR